MQVTMIHNFRNRTELRETINELNKLINEDQVSNELNRLLCNVSREIEEYLSYESR